MQVAEETQEAVLEVRGDDGDPCDLGLKTPPTSTTENGGVLVNGSRQKTTPGSSSKVIVSHSPEGSIARVVSGGGSVSRLSSVGSGYSYSVSPAGSTVSRPASDAATLRQVSNIGVIMNLLVSYSMSRDNGFVL